MATLSELKDRESEIRSRIAEIDSDNEGQALPEEVRGEWNDLNTELEANRELAKELEARKARVENLGAQPQSREAGFNIQTERTRGDDIYDLSTIRARVDSPEAATRELRERAMEAIDRATFPHESITPEEARTNVQRLLDHVDDEEGTIARRILQTGSPTYKRAFGKYLSERPLTDSERTALSTTAGAGGYAIPFTLDPSVVHTSAYSVNPWRAISRVVQVAGNNWHGVASTGVSASYGAEATEASDGSPTFAQPSIQVEKAQCFVPFSIEIGEDFAGGLQGELTSMISEAKDDLEATKFAFGAGHGSTEPKGVLVGGTATLNTAATATFAVADVYSTETSLNPRYRPRAQWVANRSIYNRIRQFDTAGGAQLWQDNLRVGLQNNVPTPGNLGSTLIGYPAHECSAMGTTITSASTIAVLGDFSRFVIVDRVGMNVETIPHLFGSSNRYPTGQRGLFAYWRNSSDVTDANAFKKLLAL